MVQRNTKAAAQGAGVVKGASVFQDPVALAAIYDIWNDDTVLKPAFVSLVASAVAAAAGAVVAFVCVFRFCVVGEVCVRGAWPALAVGACWPALAVD